jgi:hypothetical protein
MKNRIKLSSVAALLFMAVAYGAQSSEQAAEPTSATVGSGPVVATDAAQRLDPR